MKIAMIHTPFWSRAGGERQVLKLAIELEKLGHEVTVFTSGIDKESYPTFFRLVKLEVIPHPLAGKLPSRFLPASAKPILNKQLIEEHDESLRVRKLMHGLKLRQFYTSELPSMLEIGRKIPHGFDIINNHNFPTEWAAFLAKKRLNIPIVWMCNEPPFWFFNPKFRTGLNKVNWPLFEILDKISVGYIDSIAVLSRIGGGYVEKAYHRSSRVVRTGVDVTLLQKASGRSVRQNYGLKNDFVLLQAGSLDPVKRQEDTINALYYLSKKFDNVKLILDGPGSRKYLTGLVERLGLQSKVLFLCSRSDVELAEVYAACDVFVYPTSTSTWGMGPTEAMGASKPVIISKLAGASEMIQSGVNGIVVDFGKPQEIAKQAEQLMENPSLRRKIGKNAFQTVSECLSWEKYARNIEVLFEDTLTKSKTVQ
jgi:glycosyltransferase involved in cell wall biosynthesis